MDVDVELLGLQVVGGGLRWTAVSAPLEGAARPDDVARALSGLPPDEQDVVLHSTSWRHTGTGLVLTYALFPDPRAATGEPLLPHLATGPGPLEPSPRSVGRAQVAAHAVRHLADLAGGRDPVVTAVARRRPETWQVLVRHGRGVHAHAHG